jgi:hypothetical protein
MARMNGFSTVTFLPQSLANFPVRDAVQPAGGTAKWNYP